MTDSDVGGTPEAEHALSALITRWGFSDATGVLLRQGTEARARSQATVYAQLEAQVMALSRQLASLRQRHAACLEQVREQEEAAGFLQSRHAPSDPRRKRRAVYGVTAQHPHSAILSSAREQMSR
jgi:hypothetical protein